MKETTNREANREVINKRNDENPAANLGNKNSHFHDNGKYKVQRRLKGSDGIYIEGEVEGVKSKFTADTGATRSVILLRVYNSIPEQNRPPCLRGNLDTPNSVGISGVSRIPLKQFGCSIFKMKLGSLELKHELIVAEVEDEGFLGMDILFQGSDSPADILLSESIIRLHGVTIPCTQIGVPERVRKVRSCENITIPENSEVLIDAFIERKEEDDFRNKSVVLIEPTLIFEEKYKLLMASSLADIRHNISHVVRILNPLQESLYKTQSLDLERIETIVPIENRLRAQNSDFYMSSNDITEIKGNVIQRVQEVKCDLPVHLENLFNKACEHLNDTEKEQVKEMLQKHEKNLLKE